jgi:hypothetical protein
LAICTSINASRHAFDLANPTIDDVDEALETGQ